MLEISYEKRVPYSFDVTLSQYFDYEHIAHVHPTTVGEYRLVEQQGNVLTYDHIWPAGLFGRRGRSRVRHTFEPPNGMWFEFISGRYRGIRVHTRLEDCGESTLIHERYLLTLPDWGWLRPLVRPAMIRSIERIWDEDLRVEICIGGWPGIPGREEQPRHSATALHRRAGRHVIGPARDFPPTAIYRVFVDGNEVALVARDDGYRAIAGRCTHTGGPLSLGAIDGDVIVCPWHGARFCLESGEPLCGIAPSGVKTYRVAVEDGEVAVYR